MTHLVKHHEANVNIVFFVPFSQSYVFTCKAQNVDAPACVALIFDKKVMRNLQLLF